MKLKPIYLAALLICLFLLPIHSYAQEMETLFDERLSHGGFGAPIVKVSSMAGEPAVWVGGRGAWLINIGNGHAISLGGSGIGLATKHETPNPDYGNANQTYYAKSGYGGFEIEYYNRFYKLVHFTLSSMIGGGSLQARPQEDFQLGRWRL